MLWQSTSLDNSVLSPSLVEPSSTGGLLHPFPPLDKTLPRFQCSIVKSPVLKCVTMIDTPGILSGEKQRVDRGYDFVGVLQWFAERVDRWWSSIKFCENDVSNQPRIVLLFDANKLDISDEFRRSIEAIHGYEDKVRIVLNKADQVKMGTEILIWMYKSMKIWI